MKIGESKPRIPTVMLVIALLGLLAAQAAAQTAEIPRRTEPFFWTSGHHTGVGMAAEKPALTLQDAVSIPGAPWMQLRFGRGDLGRQSYLEITSLTDGATQRLDAETLAEWNNHSAYFNGDAVEVRLFVGPLDRGVSIEIHEIVVGEWGRPGTKSICGVDNRVASNEQRVGRIDPIGCTGWIIDSGQLLSAGHCLDGGSSNQTLSFNVPPSLSNGTVQFPGPEDQYSINQSSFDFVDGGVGNDWGVFAVFNNSQTGLQPIQAQGSFTVRQDLGPANIRITGFGVDSGTTNQTNQTHVGPNAGSSGTTMRYATDTQGGNSGSPVIDEATGEAVGIHTHGGCTSSGGNNNGTSFFNSALWNAIDTAPPPPPPDCTHEISGQDFESGAQGWTASGASTCTTGTFIVGTPDGTDWQVSGGNPGQAFFTQNNPGGVGTDDVDGGTCEALSPVVSGSGDMTIILDYYHGQRDAGDDAGDGFSIEVLNNGSVADTIVQVGDVTHNDVWTTAWTTISNAGNVQLRVRATDAAAAGDIVEAGLDNVQFCGTSGGCTSDAQCSDGLFCNGAETCNLSTGQCQAGTPPNCDDGVSCTVDSCNESTDTCDNVPDDGACDNGLFCDGSETCNATLGCQDGPDPCSGGQTCNETNDTCEGGGGGCSHSADFTSGAGGWTNGADTCTTGSFIVGTPDATTWQLGGGNPGQAFFTQNNPGGIGTDDVDGGTCEALSPVVDCSAESSASVSIDYYHGQRDAGDDASDGFTIEVLNNGSVVSTLVSIGDVTNNPAWTTVSTTVNNPGNIQVRVRATDAAGPGDIVEGGIDNVSIGPGGGGGCTVDDDFENGTAGWFNDGASTCATGAYVEGNPTQQTNGGVTTQVGGSNSGTTSIFTATNTSAGVNDVDGGNCILGSPSWSVANASTLSVAYWHGQRDAGDDASGDFFALEYSTNGGSSWSTLASNGDSTSNAAWSTASTSIPAGSNVQLRVQCSDGSSAGDLVECGIDDVSICDN